MNQSKVKREPARRRRTLLLSATAAAVLLIALVVVLAQNRDDAPATAAGDARENAGDLSGVNIATRFLEAYGVFEVERMGTFMADDATIASMGDQDDPRLLVSFLEATGYRQFTDPCVQTTNGGGKDPGPVRCTFSFHALRSAELGRGPFGGGVFNVAVRDGKIVHVEQDWEIKKFSPQVWEPFARWVSKAHPKEAAVMYPDASRTGVQLTEGSIRLWKRNTQRYVAHVTRSD